MALSLFDITLLGLIVLHCYISPYTKVEESFNLQAIHDLLTFGPLDLSSYDHQIFPGAVKRTFVGAGLVSLLVKPFTFFIQPVKSLITYQYLVRITLGLVNGFLIIRIRQILDKISRNKQLNFYYALLQYSQFHIIYYSSRTLPNFLLLPFVNYALGSILLGNFVGAFAWLSLVAVIFRAEIGVFALSLAFTAVLSFQVSFPKASTSLIIGGVIGLLTTLLVDSYFWSELPCVPEIGSILFNVYQGNSKLWGVEPFNAYFTKYFISIFCPPTVLLFAFPGLLSKTTITKSNSIRTIGIGSLLFVFLLSFQPHKEWRFIIYAVPGLTLLAANGAASFKKGTAVSSLVKLVIISSTLLSFILSVLMLYISSLNYPGGVAISSFNSKIVELDNSIVFQEGVVKKNITVHMDVPACMTGITLFTELDDGSLNHFNVIYDKLENKSILETEETWKKYDYVITDLDSDNSSSYKKDDFNTKLFISDDFKWNKIEVVKGFGRINVLPIISIIGNHHIAFRMIQDIIEGDFNMIVDLFNNVVIQDEKLFIYAREDL